MACDFVRGVKVSTVFLGIPVYHSDEREMQFETMVFDGVYDGVRYQYKDIETAKKGHAAILKCVQDADDELTKLMCEAERLAGL